MKIFEFKVYFSTGDKENITGHIDYENQSVILYENKSRHWTHKGLIPFTAIKKLEILKLKAEWDEGD